MRDRKEDTGPRPVERRTYGREWESGPVFEPDFYSDPTSRGSYGTDVRQLKRDLLWEMEFGKREDPGDDKDS